jgi:alanine-alpha-ketoisovalerate/valine-pyruvate aminotransferase
LEPSKSLHKLRVNFIISIHDHTIIQGSAAFVYGWMVFADRFSNGALNEIIQQLSPPESE